VSKDTRKEKKEKKRQKQVLFVRLDTLHNNSGGWLSETVYGKNGRHAPFKPKRFSQIEKEREISVTGRKPKEKTQDPKKKGRASREGVERKGNPLLEPPDSGPKGCGGKGQGREGQIPSEWEKGKSKS